MQNYNKNEVIFLKTVGPYWANIKIIDINLF